MANQPLHLTGPPAAITVLRDTISLRAARQVNGVVRRRKRSSEPLQKIEPHAGWVAESQRVVSGGVALGHSPNKPLHLTAAHWYFGQSSSAGRRQVNLVVRR
jgi:hypothetical protein